MIYKTLEEGIEAKNKLTQERYPGASEVMYVWNIPADSETSIVVGNDGSFQILLIGDEFRLFKRAMPKTQPKEVI